MVRSEQASFIYLFSILLGVRVISFHEEQENVYKFTFQTIAEGGKWNASHT